MNPKETVDSIARFFLKKRMLNVMEPSNMSPAARAPYHSLYEIATKEPISTAAMSSKK